jgi:arsenite methyltransferase
MPAPALQPLDVEDLRARVREMYVKVARDPGGEFHFEMGRALAERLGYPPTDLDEVPSEAIESFAGVGYPLALTLPRPGETVLDLGSGSGMDVFVAALHVGDTGRVIGIDMTDAQLEKAERLRQGSGSDNADFRRGELEALPVESDTIDLVISNGVINLCPDKPRVFREIFRVLRPGGRMAVADIVTDRPMPENVTCDSTLWAACIGGAAQHDVYGAAIEAAGLRVVEVRENPEYRFLSRSARNASDQYGVRSVCVLAAKPAV